MSAVETQAQTLEQRIVHLESAANIALAENDYAFAKALLDKAEWLKSIQARENQEPK